LMPLVVTNRGLNFSFKFLQSAFIFIQEEQLLNLVHQLQAQEGEEPRARALETLLLTQLADLVGGDHWAALKAGLATCLADTGTDRLADLGLKVYARLLASSSHFAVKESYLSLIETTLDWYRERRLAALLPAASVEERNPLHRRLLRMFNLIVGQSRELPRLWVRKV
jgi:hypothetical protein